MTRFAVEQIGDATLYLGDAREVLATVGRVDACIIDPPYGVDGALNSRTAACKSIQKNDYASFDDSPEYVRDVVVPIVQACIDVARGAVLTPGNRCLGFYPNPAAFGAVYQPASVGLQPWGRADAQPVFYYGRSPHGGKNLPRYSCSFQVAGESAAGNDFGHPCSKPLRLVARFVETASLVGETILDPFMGSGTTGVAALKLGRKFIGIEIEPKYFDIACKRIAEAWKQPRLFDEPAPKPEQLSLLAETSQ